ncbi:MAG: SDR family oxidoreductase [Psychrobacillus sp.]
MFDDKVVIITGAAQGIGRGVAQVYAENSAHVILADSNESLGRETEESLLQQGYSCLFIKTDVRVEKDVINLMEQTTKEFGTIDILINNAGKFQAKSPYDLSLDEWDDVIHTNLRSVFLCSREAAKIMKNNEYGGSIVSMASTRAFMSEPNSESYAATKGGIISLTHSLASSLAKDNITVNCISPGWIETGDYNDLREVDHAQHFSGRVGKPSDIAKACLYLTDPSNNFVTGTNVTIDGGMTKKMIYEA